MKSVGWLLAVGVIVVWMAGCKQDASAPPEEEKIVDPEAAALGFRLYYRERMDRMVTVYNRFGLYGSAGFGTNIRRYQVARTGDDYEVIPGPRDNNRIGTPIWSVWEAWQLFRTRTLELTLLRMFEGLVFFEQVSGQAGMTAREVYPGWTRLMDGIAGKIELTRDGTVVESPVAYDPELEQEILDTFFAGIRITYRENPAEFYFSFLPVFDLADYAMTHSFSELPHYLRVSDCCSSLMRTPAGNLWEGAFWGNHNSRDNMPDIALGYLAALAAEKDPDLSAEVRDAARRAVAAGQRIGDLVQEHEGTLMTFDEHNPYGTLVVSGAVRPHGDAENETLGELADCPAAYLVRAISSHGLTTALPKLPLPGSIERQINDLGGLFECPQAEGVRKCASFKEAFCGFSWDNIDQLLLLGEPWLELLREMEAATPGTAADLIGGMQNDFEYMTRGMVALVRYARASGQADLEQETQQGVKDISNFLRELTDILWAENDTERAAEHYYQAAMSDAQAGVEVVAAHLGNLAPESAHLQSIESMLDFAETNATPPLLSEEEILERVEAELAREEERPWGNVVERYRSEYDHQPPIRRTADGYEARGTPLEQAPWRPVENPPHRYGPSLNLFEGISICLTHPEIVDCTWAAAGCERVDLNADGTVDASDQAQYETLKATHTDQDCGADNNWCEGSDLDRSGVLDPHDDAFMLAALGCWYS